MRKLSVLVPSMSPTLIRPVQLALSLVLMTIGVLFTAELLGIGADPRESLRQSRTSVAESLAVQVSVFASMGDDLAVDRAVFSFVARSNDVRAASLVREDGRVLARHGDLSALENVASASTLTHLVLPILDGRLAWGEVQVVFEPGGIVARELHWFLFVGFFAFASFALFLGRALNQLDPGRVVPERVETAFDLFSAGVVILDGQLRIVMANKAVAQIAGRPTRELTGLTMEEWPWQERPDWQAPWATTLHSGLAVSDMPVRLTGVDGEEKLYSVSCAAVGAEDEARGVLVTLDDLTPTEHRNRELSDALRELHRTKESLSVKNRELELLASTDPLTGIANRRTLMERLSLDFERAHQEGTSLACIMCDIDYFKSVNDTYGHAVGDDVIRAVADVLKRVCREYDTIGRYGGEEFVMVLPGLDAIAAAEVAERVRVGVIALASSEHLPVSRLSSSFGVADLDSKVSDSAALVDAADKALYAAKQGGRNRVEIWGETVPEPSVSNSVISVQPSNEDLSMARVIELETLLGERERALKSLFEFDALTGVPMRTLFLQRVETELTRAERSGMFVGVISFELREIDRIISSFGHAASDALVVEFVERLQAGLRATDIVSELTAEHSLSRITSNEYGMLLSDLVDTASAMVVVTRLKRLLMQPFLVGEERVYVGSNIGIALSGAAETHAAALFGQASEARLRAAAKPDKVSHGFASAVLDDESHDYIRLEADLHDALERNELEIWFQPKFDLCERRVTGMEALLRWRHESRGFVPPSVFVAVAEANGLIGQLSTLVLNQTLKQIRLWAAMGFDDLCVSVNVSPMQLRAESLVIETLEALRNSGVPGRQLEIELTETSVLDRPEEARIALQKLRAEGISISMDDFGTGYTSLALLADLPLDTVKIDRSFVSAMIESERSQAVVESIITMAHALKLRVVGEGVETNEELEILSRFGCDEVQGYLISRPQPAKDITAFLVQQRASEQGRRRA